MLKIVTVQDAHKFKQYGKGEKFRKDKTEQHLVYRCTQCHRFAYGAIDLERLNVMSCYPQSNDD